MSSGGICQELGLSNGGFGTLYMFATLTSAALIPLARRFADTISIERNALIVIAGLVVSMVALSRAGNLVVPFAALARLRLFGQVLMGHAAMVPVGRWFVANRGEAVSTAAMGI